jgi:putative ABC transport system permease protein
MKAYRQNVRENLLLALDTLRGHKFRSFLTVLGVLIGTTTVILVASLIQGLDKQVSDVMQDFGAHSLFIFKFNPGINFNLSKEERMRKPLTYEDAMAIKEQCSAIKAVGVQLVTFGPSSVVTAKYKGKEMLDAALRGVNLDALLINHSEIADGRLFSEADDSHRRDVAVIGADVAKRLFESEDAVGKELTVNGHNFQVIGTLARRKAVLGANQADSIVFIPYFTYKKLFPATKEHFINAEAYPDRLDQAYSEVEGLLRQRRKVKPSEPDNFGISTAESIVTQFRQIIGTIALVMIVISSIGLLVGGIGVMNIMLVSVTERTREIGVRKAIGARRSDITWQFLLEAMALTGAGGLLGILLGWLLSLAIRNLVPTLPSTVPLWSVVTGFVVAVSVGLFFGMWPALKAARLDPIVALRYE